MWKFKPEKEERERTRLTVGGNLLEFTGNISDATASVTTAKCVFNSLCQLQGQGVYWPTSNLFTWTMSYRTLNLCAFPWKLSHRKSLMLTTSQRWSSTKGGSTCALRRACMASNKTVSSRATHNWPMGSWQHTHQFYPCVWQFLCSIFLDRGCQLSLNSLRAKYLITVDMEATVYILIKL